MVSVKHHPAHYVNIVDMTLIAVLLLCGLIYGPAWLFMVVEELYTLVCIYLGFFKKKKICVRVKMRHGPVIQNSSSLQMAAASPPPHPHLLARGKGQQPERALGPTCLSSRSLGTLRVDPASQALSPPNCFTLLSSQTSPWGHPQHTHAHIWGGSSRKKGASNPADVLSGAGQAALCQERLCLTSLGPFPAAPSVSGFGAC